MSVSSDAVREPSSAPSIIAIILLIATLLALGGAVYTNLQDQAADARYRAIVGDLRVSVQQAFGDARLAANGEEEAFSGLTEAKLDFEKSLKLLQQGDAELTPITAWLPAQYRSLQASWSTVAESIDTILANQDRILFLHEVADTLNESIPELQQEYNLVVDILVDTGSRSDQVVLAQRQALLGERIARNVEKMLAGGEAAAGAADQFNLDASLFGSVLRGMIDGNAAMRIAKVTDQEAVDSLEAIDELYSFVNNSVDKIFQASPDLSNTRQALDLILSSAGELNNNIDTMLTSVDTIASQRLVKQEYLYALAALALFFIIILAYLTSTNARRRLEVEEQTNEASQRAILTLLDELADLADGDLRTKATVTEEFTGAIADSINFTIDQLRILVSRITNASVSISSAAAQAKDTSTQLSQSATEQAKKITEATLAINEMAETITAVSSSAEESADVATKSVEIAKNGGDVVRNTIGGMDTIREQIQDTSKRIKRLGESSQEIGDIVSLINDIADQTNILSLNAAIQASMAGDAGRGFAVVADEVQRLAERSSSATKQIEALVKAIQTDTNEAVVSMEQTTTEVVRGAQLAQNAGVALEEIETVSSDIAQLIKSISVSARDQAMKALDVSNTMNVIQDITTQTSAGAAATADSIGKLTDLSVAMKDSVSGFSLPETLADDDGEVDVDDVDEFNDFSVDAGEDVVDADGEFDESESQAPEEPPVMFDTVSDLGAFVKDDTEADDEDIELQPASDDAFEDESWEATVRLDNVEEIAIGDDDDFAEIEIDEIEELSAGLDAETDDDDSFEIDDIVSPKSSAAKDDDDEFMMGLDDDFDLDLDDFSFDDEPVKKS